LYGQYLAGAQINFLESGRSLGHLTPTIFGSTVGYPSDSLASCNELRANCKKNVQVTTQLSGDLSSWFRHAIFEWAQLDLGVGFVFLQRLSRWMYLN